MHFLEFNPKCPRCGKSETVERVLDTINLICVACRCKFRIFEIEE